VAVVRMRIVAVSVSAESEGSSSLSMVESMTERMAEERTIMAETESEKMVMRIIESEENSLVAESLGCWGWWWGIVIVVLRALGAWWLTMEPNQYDDWELYDDGIVVDVLLGMIVAVQRVHSIQI
jgi:hypothetical protein